MSSLILVLLLLCIQIALLTYLLFSLESIQVVPHAIIDYIKGSSYGHIDIILLGPCVEGEVKEGKCFGTNYTVLSILRFAPWIKTIHLQIHQKLLKHVDVWKSWTTASRITYFIGSPLTYSLTSPILSQDFIIMDSNCFFSNYVFPWQFFFRDSPVVRTSYMGCYPTKRKMFNQAGYLQSYNETLLDVQTQYVTLKGLTEKTILFQDNLDMLSFSFANDNLITSITSIDSKPVPLELIGKYLKYEEKNKSTKKTFNLVLIVVQNHTDDASILIPSSLYQECIKLWVKVSELGDGYDRLSFVHRMIATHSMFVELVPSQFKNIEEITVDIVKNIRSLSNGEVFNVKNVLSYGIDDSYQLINNISNKLASFYDTVYEVFPSDVELDDMDKSENTRLQNL